MAETFISGADGQEVFQAQYIPKQKGPPLPDSPSMKIYLSTFPALGQVTLVDKSTSVFTALLEVDESRIKDPCQVSLWYTEGEEWQEVPMDALVEASSEPTSLQSPKSRSSLHKVYFSTPLTVNLPTTFTVKFRNGTDTSWKWVKDHQGSPDGVVMLKTVTSQSDISSDLGDYVENLNAELQVKHHLSQSPGTTLWSVEVPVEAAKGGESLFKDVMFGVPWGIGKFSR